MGASESKTLEEEENVSLVTNEGYKRAKAVKESVQLQTEFEKTMETISEKVYDGNKTFLLEKTKYLYQKYTVEETRDDAEKAKIEKAYRMMKDEFDRTLMGYNLVLELANEKCGVGLITFVCAAAFLKQKDNEKNGIKGKTVLTIVLPDQEIEVAKMKEKFEVLLVELALYRCNVDLMFSTDGFSRNDFMALRRETKENISKKIESGNSVFEYKFVNVLRYFTQYEIETVVSEFEIIEQFKNAKNENVLSVTFTSNFTLVECDISADDAKLEKVKEDLKQMKFDNSNALTKEKSKDVHDVNKILGANVCVIAETNGDTTVNVYAVFCTDPQFDDIMKHFEVKTGKMKKNAANKIDSKKNDASVFWIIDLKGSKRTNKNPDKVTGKTEKAFFSEMIELQKKILRETGEGLLNAEKILRETGEGLLNAEKMLVRVIGRERFNKFDNVTKIDAPFVVMDSQITLISQAVSEPKSVFSSVETSKITGPQWYEVPVMYWDVSGIVTKAKRTGSDVDDEGGVHVEEKGESSKKVKSTGGAAAPPVKKSVPNVPVAVSWENKYGPDADALLKQIVDMLNDIKNIPSDEKTEEGQKAKVRALNGSITRFRTTVAERARKMGDFVNEQVRTAYAEKITENDIVAEEIVATHIKEVISGRLKAVIPLIRESRAIVDKWYADITAGDSLSADKISDILQNKKNINKPTVNEKLNRRLDELKKITGVDISKTTLFVKESEIKKLLWKGYPGADEQEAHVEKVQRKQRALFELLNEYHAEKDVLSSPKLAALTNLRNMIKKLIAEAPETSATIFFVVFHMDYVNTYMISKGGLAVLYALVDNQLSFLQAKLEAMVATGVDENTKYKQKGFFPLESQTHKFLRDQMKSQANAGVFLYTQRDAVEKIVKEWDRIAEVNNGVFEKYEDDINFLARCRYGRLEYREIIFSAADQPGEVGLYASEDVQLTGFRKVTLQGNGHAGVRINIDRLLEECVPLNKEEEREGRPDLFVVGGVDRSYVKSGLIRSTLQLGEGDIPHEVLNVDLVFAEYEGKNLFAGDKKTVHEITVTNITDYDKNGSKSGTLYTISSYSSADYEQYGWMEELKLMLYEYTDEERIAEQEMAEETVFGLAFGDTDMPGGEKSSSSRGGSSGKSYRSGKSNEEIEMEEQRENRLTADELLREKLPATPVPNFSPMMSEIKDFVTTNEHAFDFFSEFELQFSGFRIEEYVEGKVQEAMDEPLENLPSEDGINEPEPDPDADVIEFYTWHIRQIVRKHREARPKAVVEKLYRELMDNLELQEEEERLKFIADINRDAEEFEQAEEERFEFVVKDSIRDALGETVEQLQEFIDNFVNKEDFPRSTLRFMVSDIVLEFRKVPGNMDFSLVGAKIALDQPYAKYYVVTKDGMPVRFLVSKEGDNTVALQKKVKSERQQLNGPFTLTDEKTFRFPEAYVVITVTGDRNKETSYKDLKFYIKEGEKGMFDDVKLRGSAFKNVTARRKLDQKNTHASLKVESV